MESRSTQDARRDFAALIEDVLRGEHVELTRYGRPVATVVPPEWHKRFADPAALAEAVASALETAAVADWESEPGDGKQIEIYVSQIAPIVARVLAGGEARS